MPVHYLGHIGSQPGSGLVLASSSPTPFYLHQPLLASPLHLASPLLAYVRPDITLLLQLAMFCPVLT